MARNDPTTKSILFAGLRTVDAPEEVGINGLVKAENVDLTKKFHLKRRKGRTLRTTQANDSGYIDSGVGMITSGASLFYVKPDLTLATVRTDLTPGGDIIFHKFGDRIYYSNGYENGVYDAGQDRSLGITRPDAAPTMASTSGDFGAGRVLCACSFVGEGGQESGLSPTKLLESNGGGISFTDIPVSSDDRISNVRIYLSHPDGDILYRGLQVTNGVTNASYRGHQTFLQVPQTTQYLDKPPVFQAIDMHNGRMLYARDKYLFFSEPFGLELVDYRIGWFDLGDRITALGVVENGVHVATVSATWYLGGNNIQDASLKKTADYGAVPRTRRYISGNLLGGDLGDSPLPMWVSTRGFVIGTESGDLLNVSEKEFTLPAGVKGTAMFRREDGQNHYIAVIQN